MRMEDFTKAFPGRVNIDAYKPVIEAALKASKGEDGFPRVVVEEFATQKEAVKAANAIRNHCKSANPELHVSCPESGRIIRVYRSAVPRKTRKKRAAGPEPPTGPGNEALQTPA